MTQLELFNPPVNLSIYPTKDSLEDVRKLGESLLPINNKNELTRLLNLHHNTMLRVLGQETK